MKSKYAPYALLVAAFSAAVLVWAVLPAPAVQAHEVSDSGRGEMVIPVELPNGGRSPGPGETDEPGLEADPDTFQIDSWNGAEIDRIETPAPPAPRPARGFLGWIADWVLLIVGGDYGYLGLGR